MLQGSLQTLNTVNVFNFLQFSSHYNQNFPEDAKSTLCTVNIPNLKSAGFTYVLCPTVFLATKNYKTCILQKGNQSTARKRTHLKLVRRM